VASIFPGRHTAKIEGPFVVFLIGFRINRFFAFSKWLPVAKAMPPMLKELYQHPEMGFLGAQTFLYWPGISTVQYLALIRAVARVRSHAGGDPFACLGGF
jgi:hypothetical protein